MHIKLAVQISAVPGEREGERDNTPQGAVDLDLMAHPLLGVIGTYCCVVSARRYDGARGLGSVCSH